jgi:hypothetical protein
MAISRIAFALSDAMNEIKALDTTAGDRPDFRVDIHMDYVTYNRVIDALQHHFGAQLQKDAHYRGVGRAVRFAGMRLIMVPPGNRDG